MNTNTLPDKHAALPHATCQERARYLVARSGLKLAAGQPPRAGRRRSQGNSLVMVLVLAAAAVMVVAAAMTLAAQRNSLSARSAAWNSAIPVAEAGIEEALTQLNYGMAVTNGWRFTNGYYLKTQTNPFSSGDSYYSVAITATNPPVVTSVGYVRAPLQNTYISRTVQITTIGGVSNATGGLLAKNQIHLGGGSLMNSFNSCDTNFSTGGLYDPAKARDKIKVATDSIGVPPPAIAVGTTLIYGSVATGPGGTITVNNSGGVGDAGYLSGGGTGAIQPGHSANNMNVAMPDVQVPYTSGAPLVSGSYNVGGTNYSYCLGATNYYSSSSFNVSGDIIVTNAATVYVTASVTLSGLLYIAPGASLTLYVGDTGQANDSFSMGGKGIANGTGQAVNFAVKCLPSVKNANYTGGSSWVGTLFAPETSFSLGGGSDACGSVMALAISLSGGVSFHYDECLGQDTGTKLVVNAWHEL
jgi:hypothetical protein